MCVFCDIANKKIETSVVYENNNVMAFLDYEPINEGHIFPRYSGDGFGWTDSGKQFEHSQNVADKIAEALA